MIYSISLLVFCLRSFGYSGYCKAVIIIRFFGFLPILITSLCIIIRSFFILKNFNYLTMKQNFLKIIFLLFIWGPSFILFILFFILKAEMHKEFCFIETPEYFRYILMIFNFVIYGLTLIICIILIIRVCKINVSFNKQLTNVKSKIIRNIFFYIFALLLNLVLYELLFEPLFAVSRNARPFIFPFLCLTVFINDYIFLWNKDFIYAIKVFYCCAKKKPLEINQIEEQVDNEDIKEYFSTEIDFEDELQE